MTYADKLKDPRWQKKRLEIFNRDEWSCQVCGDPESTLAVHHLRYIQGKEPWEYENNLLITLCQSCHEIERESMPAAEDDIISVLKGRGFLSGDIHDITEGFISLESGYIPCVTASVIKWIFQNREVFAGLEEEYFKSIAASNKRES